MTQYKVYAHTINIDHYVLSADSKQQAIDNVYKLIKGTSRQVFPVAFHRKYVKIKKVKEIIEWSNFNFIKWWGMKSLKEEIEWKLKEISMMNPIHIYLTNILIV